MRLPSSEEEDHADQDDHLSAGVPSFFESDGEGDEPPRKVLFEYREKGGGGMQSRRGKTMAGVENLFGSNGVRTPSIIFSDAGATHWAFSGDWAWTCRDSFGNWESDAQRLRELREGGQTKPRIPLHFERIQGRRRQFSRPSTISSVVLLEASCTLADFTSKIFKHFLVLTVLCISWSSWRFAHG